MNIKVSKDFFDFSVVEWEGETLEMSKISRLDMGAYLCIASNGVPPSVSKRIKVSVDCKLSNFTSVPNRNHFLTKYFSNSSTDDMDTAPASGHSIDLQCNT